MINDNYIRTGKVINVVDGDTVDMEVDLGFHTITKQRFRLLRINCPEKFGETREEGLTAKEFTKSQLLNKEVTFQSVKTDSFNRWLAEIWFIDENGNQVNISDKLLKSGLAIDYIK